MFFILFRPSSLYYSIGVNSDVSYFFIDKISNHSLWWISSLEYRGLKTPIYNYLIDKPQQLQSVLWVVSWGQIRWSLQGTKAMGKIQASQLYYTLPCPACLPTIKYIKHKIRPTIGGQKTMLRLFCRRGRHQWGWGGKIQ